MDNRMKHKNMSPGLKKHLERVKKMREQRGRGHGFPGDFKQGGIYSTKKYNDCCPPEPEQLYTETALPPQKGAGLKKLSKKARNVVRKGSKRLSKLSKKMFGKKTKKSKKNKRSKQKGGVDCHNKPNSVYVDPSTKGKFSKKCRQPSWDPDCF